VPGHRQARPDKGRRGTPGTSGPHGLVSKGKRHEKSTYRSRRLFPDIPRAVFLGLLYVTPGGRTF